MSVLTKAISLVFGAKTAEQFPVVIKMHSQKASLYDAIIFPYIDLSDPMNETLFRKITSDMERTFTGSYARVDICAIRDILNLARITLWGRAAEAFEWLHRLHCVSFADMHPEIAAQVPHRINMVFASGDYAYPWESA